MEVRMQTRLARSWTALRYDLSSQRALDNAARATVARERLLAESAAWFFRGVGQIPIRREGGSASERALASATEVLQAGGVFAIYPEGTRTRDGFLHRGHTGVARLCLRTGTPVVPVGLIGTDEVQPVDRRMP